LIGGDSVAGIELFIKPSKIIFLISCFRVFVIVFKFLMLEIDQNILNKLRNFFIYWFPIFLYCLLIFLQSSRPSPRIMPVWPFMDKVLHFAAFALLGALFLRAFYTTRIRHHLILIVTLSILFSALFGISDEIHQSFVPYRTADAMDVLADTLGSAFGAGVYSLWFKGYFKNRA